MSFLSYKLFQFHKGCVWKIITGTLYFINCLKYYLKNNIYIYIKYTNFMVKPVECIITLCELSWIVTSLIKFYISSLVSINPVPDQDMEMLWFIASISFHGHDYLRTNGSSYTVLSGFIPPWLKINDQSILHHCYWKQKNKKLTSIPIFSYPRMLFSSVPQQVEYTIVSINMKATRLRLTTGVTFHLTLHSLCLM